MLLNNFAFIYQQLSSVKDWSNVFFIEAISKAFRFASYDIAKESISHLLSTLLNASQESYSITQNSRPWHGFETSKYDNLFLSLTYSILHQQQSRQLWSIKGRPLFYNIFLFNIYYYYYRIDKPVLNSQNQSIFYNQCLCLSCSIRQDRQIYIYIIIW